MAHNLFAACRDRDGKLIARNVPLDEDVRREVQSAFVKQEKDFREGVTKDVRFDGGWNPNENEFLIIDPTDVDAPEKGHSLTAEAQILIDAITIEKPSNPSINTRKIEDAEIKALFTGSSENGAIKILIQRFTASHVLSHKMALRLSRSRNVFRKLDNFVFTLPNSLTCILEDGKLKFKSFYNLKSIFRLLDFYKEATEEDVRQFALHKVHVDDVEDFIASADQNTRKLIYAITERNILEDCKASDIRKIGREAGLKIEIKNQKIIVPSDRKMRRDLLNFLNENIFPGPITNTVYVTNSKKPK